MFGIDLFDASLVPSMIVALLGGLLSFLSPCVLPIVPPYLAYMGGITISEMGEVRTARRRAVLSAFFFILGLSTVFILLGATASVFGRFFLQNQEWFVILSGVVVMVFGAHFVGVYRIPILDREARIDAGDKGGSAFGAYLLGLAFAFGWTPCIGPQLGMILSIAAQDGSVSRGGFLLAVYAMGLGIPFLLVAAFFPSMTGVIAWMKRHMMQIERTMGLLLWTVGLMMVTGKFTDLAWWLNEKFPVLQNFG
ncbi:cytochrome c biogenesis CcdA family protein [Pseudohalocynthiibacter aestuariivivens]|uniref:Cytochrome c biogenesis CcdA family protein n=1 Tax=Pseudohalocynthiibacter aestuariivivens TaxID=1591409 RepID=A0ABV5JEW7_9RHOB|nr:MULTISPECIES: cytochrome c biogenesis protein CcdA [Pseudohalocynthiibacter]MBS9718724.1 cytochrome c biogenesis protein CcdA [Pseudohalocynthiibacter aestuariivivens]MCK0104343.1 cytochrome c biogenesis protein CcdA [Pseudohalocynthiibacter sp. F2068]